MWLPLMTPYWVTWPTIQACALTENRTSDPSVHRPVLNPLSHTSQGTFYYRNMWMGTASGAPCGTWRLLGEALKRSRGADRAPSLLRLWLENCSVTGRIARVEGVMGSVI